MGRPHLHLDRPRSPLEVARIQRGLTLAHASRLMNGQLSVSMLNVMERSGRGSRHAWEIVAAALSVSLNAILPASPALGDQLRLWGSSS